MMKLGTFVREMLKVGCIGFGGGSALIPVIENAFLKKGKLDTRKNYETDIVVASITPGALPVELASSLGQRNFGIFGMMAGACAMALPGALLAFLLFSILASAKDEMLDAIRIIAVGVAPYIIAQLLNYMQKTLKISGAESKDRLNKTYFVIALVCLLSCEGALGKLLGWERTPIFGLSTVYVLIAVIFVACFTRSLYDWFHVGISAVLCFLYFLGHGKAGILAGHPLLHVTEALMIILAVYGLLHPTEPQKKTKKADTRTLGKNLGAWALFLIIFSIPALRWGREAFDFLGRAMISVLMSFGGGDAYLTIADGLFIDSGMLGSDLYYGSIVSVVNLLPGSILTKTLVGIGYYLGLEQGSTMAGVVFAVAGFAASVAVSGISFHLVACFYETLTGSKIFRVVGRWIRPVICGLLFSIILSLLGQSRLAAACTTVPMPAIMAGIAVLSLVDFKILTKKEWKNYWLILCNLIFVLILFVAK